MAFLTGSVENASSWRSEKLLKNKSGDLGYILWINHNLLELAKYISIFGWYTSCLQYCHAKCELFSNLQMLCIFFISVMQFRWHTRVPTRICLVCFKVWKKKEAINKEIHRNCSHCKSNSRWKFWHKHNWDIAIKPESKHEWSGWPNIVIVKQYSF